MTNQPYSMVEQYAKTSRGAAELAAAEFTASISRLLWRAAKASPVRQGTVAETLGVSEGRVSQVINSDGNIYTAAFAKYMMTLGYRVKVVVEPINSSYPTIDSEPSRGRPRRSRTGHRTTVHAAKPDEMKHTYSVDLPEGRRGKQIKSKKMRKFEPAKRGRKPEYRIDTPTERTLERL
ncbi:hypothetical protein [Hoyosella subflava]|uniref:Transcriptional regulator, Fis family n=1 Tax=Hoyosella subflava (strain DSM 45089 / JCM 17490 / NBRC 109087 / DQS3-9A1) TaxID=443218 RepID=F6ELJ6_HOYSD|nr:hypothetical protein [Hoyosella subflava]AEF40246.1 Transcriptional regulator, Fis family [Hoyosella subflava DQS3-9A1]